MLLLFYFLFKIVEFIGIEKLSKGYAKTVAYLFNGVQLRIHAFSIKDIVYRYSRHTCKLLKFINGNMIGFT